MNESLFKAVPQSQGAIGDRETTFEFLKRGGRKEAIEIREWIERWFREYPEDHAKELRKPLQSKHFAEFMGAYFELQVYSSLRRFGCDVEVHPNFPGTQGTVDFGVTHGEDSFYVEATVCGIGRGSLRSNDVEENAVRKIRQAIRHPHSDVWLDAEGELLTHLRKSRLVDPVQSLLDSFSPDAVPGLGEVPEWRRPQTSIQEGDWKLDISLARPIASNGKGRVQGLSRGGSVDGVSPIENALEDKTKDWAEKKRDDATFVIALNSCHSESWSGDELMAIYGKSDPVIGQDSFSEYLSRVAGVIVVDNATLGAEKGASVRMHANPDRGIPECLRPLQQKTSLGELIGLT